MADPTPPPELNPLPWVELALKVLSAVETLLPALLVAWNNELRSKVAAAQEQQAFAEAKLKGELDARKIGDETMGLGRRALLDRAIRKSRGDAGVASPGGVPAGG